MKLNVIFKPIPSKWGLRGDPLLWKAIEKRLSDEDMPETVEAMAEILEDAFRTETSYSLGLIDTIHDEKFASGGMSSGVVSGEYWRDIAFPLLLQRFVNLRGSESYLNTDERNFVTFKF